jgi:hypothetical protein
MRPGPRENEKGGREKIEGGGREKGKWNMNRKEKGECWEGKIMKRGSVEGGVLGRRVREKEGGG